MWFLLYRAKHACLWSEASPNIAQRPQVNTQNPHLDECPSFRTPASPSSVYHFIKNGPITQNKANGNWPIASHKPALMLNTIFLVREKMNGMCILCLGCFVYGIEGMKRQQRSFAIQRWWQSLTCRRMIPTGFHRSLSKIKAISCLPIQWIPLSNDHH